MLFAEPMNVGRLSPRRGFTLLEVVIAVGLSALVILCARLLIERLADSVVGIAAAARTSDEEANGERLLHSLVGNIEVGTADTRFFGGDEHTVRFTSWCMTSAGWLERCGVRLSTETIGDGYALVVRLPAERFVTLRTSSRPIELRYLENARHGGTWLPRWGDGLAAPRALGVLTDSDTVIVRIGDRG